MEKTFRPVMFRADETERNIILRLLSLNMDRTPIRYQTPSFRAPMLANDYQGVGLRLGYTCSNSHASPNRVEVHSVKEFIEACGVEYKEPIKENIMSNTFKKVSFKPDAIQLVEILTALKNANVIFNKTNGVELWKNASIIVNNINGSDTINIALAPYERRHENNRVEVFSVKEFLDACNLKVETLKEKETRLVNELKEVRKELKDQQPKVGDIGVFSSYEDPSKVIGVLGDLSNLNNQNKRQIKYHLMYTTLHYDNFEPLKNSSDFDYSKLQELLKVDQ